MQAVGVAIIAYEIYGQVAEWLSVCGVYYRKGLETDMGSDTLVEIDDGRMGAGSGHCE